MATATSAPPGAPAPGLLDALSLLTEVADELVVGTVRDTHFAWADRVHGLLHGTASAPGAARRGIAATVYGGLGAGLRAASRGLDAVGATGVGPRLESHPSGRFLNAAVNGLIGDRLERERPRLAIPMAVRAHGHDVPLDREALAAAYPGAGPRLVVFLHGLCESEDCWDRAREELGTTYPSMLAERDWTPVLLRANTGLSLRENGAALTALLQRLVDEWPAEVHRIALVGHSMGGLVLRAATAVATEAEASWTRLVSDVVTLGAPHLGAPLAGYVGHGSRALARVPEAAAFGRILDQRSVGVHDLVAGLAEEAPPLPRARYRLVSGTLTTSPRHPVGCLLGDLLVRPSSAYGRKRGREDLFPDADVLHVPRAGHFALLNHPEVHRALAEWLA